MVNGRIDNEKQMKEFMKSRENEQAELERLYKEIKEEEDINMKR